MKKRDSVIQVGPYFKKGHSSCKRGTLVVKGDSLRKVGPYSENKTLVEKAGLSSKSGTLFGKGVL